MEDALRILEDNPFHDEAIFASLSIIAKHNNPIEFQQKRKEIWLKIGGASFFKRLFLTDTNMSILGLNLLTLFCEEEDPCAKEIRNELNEEILSVCQHCLKENDLQGLRDGLQCILRLRNLIGTCGFLIEIMKNPSHPLHELALTTFMNTYDRFFLQDEEEKDLIQLMKTINFDKIGQGVIKRITMMTMRIKYLIDMVSLLINILKTKNITTQQRRVALNLYQLCLYQDTSLVCSSSLENMVIPTTIASIELRVGLERIGSEDEKDETWKEELDSLSCSCLILDRITSWIILNPIEDDIDAGKFISSITSALNVSCQFFSSISKNNQLLIPLKSHLVSFVSSCLNLFYMDDPITGKGLQEIAIRSNFVKVCGNMIQDADESVVTLLLPLLYNLPSDLYIKSCRNSLNTLVKTQWLPSFQKKNNSALFFAGCIIIFLLCALHNEEEGDSNAPLFKNITSWEYPITNMESRCVYGSLLCIKYILNVAKEKEKIRKYLKEADEIMKSSEEEEEEENYFMNDVQFQITWRDLKKICQILRMECI